MSVARARLLSRRPDPRPLQATTPAALLSALGVRGGPGLLQACVLPLLLTAALFAGPLAMWAVDWRRGRPAPAPAALPRGPLPLRNLLVAPLTEEAAFRGCLLPFLLLRGAGPVAAGALSLATFGGAHLHHLHGLVTFEGWGLAEAARAVLFQAAYTSLFGAYASFLLLRTGRLAAPVLAHAFCNLMGLPRFGHLPRYPAPVAWAFALGVAAFFGLLRPMTEPRLYGYAQGSSYVSELLAGAAL